MNPTEAHAKIEELKGALQQRVEVLRQNDNVAGEIVGMINGIEWTLNALADADADAAPTEP